MKIAPSILSLDINNLAKQLPLIEKESDWLHIDIMDGQYVPNTSFGVSVVEFLRSRTKMLLDTHLMVQKPERFFEAFAKAGSGLISFHAETAENPLDAVRQVKNLGCKAGLALNNSIPVEKALSSLNELDLVLVMGVKAGFGAQSFIEKNLEKIRVLRKAIDAECLEALIEVDGGVNAKTGKMILEAGADVLVMGNAVFAQGTPVESLMELKKLFGME